MPLDPQKFRYTLHATEIHTKDTYSPPLLAFQHGQHCDELEHKVLAGNPASQRHSQPDVQRTLQHGSFVFGIEPANTLL